MASEKSAFAALLDATPVTVNNYNIAEVKHALDDSVRKILTKDHKFIEDNTHVDRKLLLGFSSCFFAIGGALYGHFNDFQESKLLVTIAIVLYSILNSSMLLYTWFVEKDTIFVGVRKGNGSDEKILVSAKCNKAKAEYFVKLTISGKKTVSNAFTKSFGTWFDVDGELAADVLVRDVGSLLVDKKSQ
ncbi:hypothetical protein HDU81_005608 [Chytriomyces hyalinus]|nr:hypothetical protein HDU81_005608 [Chytriomyces hyalinus]